MLIKSLHKKDSPFCYLDTHAGSGRYNLTSTPAQKTKEYENGIGKIIKHKEALVDNIWLQNYLEIIAKINNQTVSSLKTSPKFYPGSPLVVQHLLRKNDRMILIELHPEDVKILKNEFKDNKQISVHLNDAYLALKAFLPPKEKRGLIFIDPPFEQVNEFEQILEGLKNALMRFKNGIYVIWYPIKERAPIKKFHQELEKILINNKIENKSIIELKIHKEEIAERLNGCGVVIINTPWKFEKDVQGVLVKLREILTA
jgi:23S rRNA (adenine2030-N6)-methyltransferase